MDVNQFISDALRDRADLKPERVRAIVRMATTLTEARETLGEYVEPQAVADRIIQEIVLEDETVDKEEFAAQMPLIEPRNETISVGHSYVEDLSAVGKYRYGLSFPPGSEAQCKIKRERLSFLGVRNDGHVEMVYDTADSMSLPEEDLEKVVNIITMDDPLATFQETHAE